MRVSVAIFIMVIIGVSAFSAGVYKGWDSGVKDGKNMEVCSVYP